MKTSIFNRVIAIAVMCVTTGITWATQGTPPKTNLPQSFVESVKSAFEHGLFDPTGGEFYEVTIITDKTLDGDRGKFKASGWLMPAQGNQKAYVICWDGMEYRNYELGSKLNLASFIKKQERMRDYYGDSRISEFIGASVPVSPIGIALLLRLGHVDLAESLAPKEEIPAQQLSAELGQDVLWFRYNRAVQAWNRKQYELAKEDAGWLAKNSKEFEPNDGNNTDFYQALHTLYLALYRDSDRRMGLVGRPAFDPKANESLPIEQRVKQIIDYLDEVDATMYFSDEPIWNGDPIFRAALKVGDPMLDALIDSAEKDERISSIGYSHRRIGRSIIYSYVRSISEQLIKSISGMRHFPRTSDYKIDFSVLRAQIAQLKGKSLPERLCTILEMDSSTPAQWVDAAEMLMMPSVTMSIDSTSSQSKPNSMLSESLRDKTSPSLTKLLAERALQAYPSKSQEYLLSYVKPNSLALARCLVTWDPKNSRETLLELTERLVSRLASLSPYEQDRRSGLVNNIGELSKLRLKIGDTSVLKDYEVVLLTSKPDRSSECVGGLKILAEYPKWGGEVAKKLFLGKDAKWSMSQLASKGNFWCIDALLDSDLDRLSALQESVIVALNDKSDVGVATWDGIDQVNYSLTSGDSGTLRYKVSPDAYKNTKRQIALKLRVCDIVAYCLNDRGYEPKVGLDLDEKAKDATIRQLIATIRKEGLAKGP